MKPVRIRRNVQQGVMLLEALVGILIFSIGILAVVGMQAMAVKTVAESKYRMDASFLANEVIGEMWLHKPSLASYAYTGGTYPAVLTEWGARLEQALPGVAKNPPTIEIGAGNIVTVTIYWQHPEEANQASPPDPHSFRAITYIN
jgi:type IV pilus assembly protein PilV